MISNPISHPFISFQILSIFVYSVSDWWFGTCFLVHILGMSSSQLTKSNLFQRGRPTTNQYCTLSHVYIYIYVYIFIRYTIDHYCYRYAIVSKSGYIRYNQVCLSLWPLWPFPHLRWSTPIPWPCAPRQKPRAVWWDSCIQAKPDQWSVVWGSILFNEYVVYIYICTVILLCIYIYMLFFDYIIFMDIFYIYTYYVYSMNISKVMEVYVSNEGRMTSYEDPGMILQVEVPKLMLWYWSIWN